MLTEQYIRSTMSQFDEVDSAVRIVFRSYRRHFGKRDKSIESWSFQDDTIEIVHDDSSWGCNERGYDSIPVAWLTMSDDQLQATFNEIEAARKLEAERKAVIDADAKLEAKRALLKKLQAELKSDDVGD